MQDAALAWKSDFSGLCSTCWMLNRLGLDVGLDGDIQSSTGGVFPSEFPPAWCCWKVHPQCHPRCHPQCHLCGSQGDAGCSARGLASSQPRASRVPLAQGPSSGFAGWLCSGWLLPGWPKSLQGAGVTWPCSRVPIAVCTFQSQAQTGVKNSQKTHIDLLHFIISTIFPLFPPFFSFFPSCLSPVSRPPVQSVCK